MQMFYLVKKIYLGLKAKGVSSRSCSNPRVTITSVKRQQRKGNEILRIYVKESGKRDRGFKSSSVKTSR